MGKIYPQAVVSPSDQFHVYAQMNHNQLEKSSEYSKVRKITKEALKGNLPAPNPTTILTWSVKGSPGGLTGSFVKLLDNKRLFLKVKGREYGNDMKEFGEGAQAYARYLSAAGEDVAPDVADKKQEDQKKAYIPEEWKSSKNGKTIKATFVSLEDGKITLKMTNGKTVTFSLDKLSQESQERAETLKIAKNKT